jgi:hypothetical protein
VNGVPAFRAAFGHLVRVELNWDEAARRASRVSVRHCRFRTELGEFYTVWYAGADGADVGFAEAGARPLLVCEAAAPARLTASRDRVVRGFERKFSRIGEPISLALPVYTTDSGAEILLDGNHRAVAAYRCELPVDLIVHRLHGPALAAILPDLAHHAD